MSAKPTPKQLKSILKRKFKANKRVRVYEDAHVKVNSTPNFSPKSKGRQRETVPRSVETTFKLVTGSYEKLLYGLEGSITLDEGDRNRMSVSLKPIFIFPAHVSCVKAVSGSPMGGKWLATGSVDEIVKVWDLRRRKEVGGLMQHEGESCRIHLGTRNASLSRFGRFYH